VVKFWGRSPSKWEDEAPEQVPAPGRPEPPLCPICRSEVYFQSQMIRGAPTSINVLAHCETHGQVTPAEPPLMTLGPGAWGSSLPPPGSWRSPTQEAEPPRRRRPPMAPLYAVRAPKRPPKPRPRVPMDPLEYGNR
jgi:hypothetical protein